MLDERLRGGSEGGRGGGGTLASRVSFADLEALSEEEELGGVHLLQGHGSPRHAVPPV